MTYDPVLLSNLMLVVTGFGGAFLAALWLSLVIWTYRDSRNRARDRLVHILAALLVALLSLPGILIYLVLRPQNTLEEEYQRTLEEEALLQAIEDQAICPGCERRILGDWQICPNCHTKLRKPCQHCGKLIELPWNICPYCATPVPGLRAENELMSENIELLVGGNDLEALQENISSQVDDNVHPDQDNLSNEP
jgi:RNA polymerase subunit RPABC4/transcription elongation factor Spt4